MLLILIALSGQDAALRYRAGAYEATGGGDGDAVEQGESRSQVQGLKNRELGLHSRELVGCEKKKIFFFRYSPNLVSLYWLEGSPCSQLRHVKVQQRVQGEIREPPS